MCLELACRLNLRVRCGEREGEQTCEQACEQAEGSRQQREAAEANGAVSGKEGRSTP